jgi:putative tricarboxylic transport membrane protein
MEAILGLYQGFVVAFTPINILYCFLGVFLGTLIGVLPGVGPAAGLALLIPATFGMEPISAIIMLSGLYYGSMYGGSTTSILVNIPGEAASVVTCIEGHQMAKKGRAGAALAVSAVGSWIAGCISVILLMFLAPPLADAALSFGPPEYFSLMVMAFVVLAPLASGSATKGFFMAALGLMLGSVGIDPVTGYQRFTFGFRELLDGIGFVPVVMGLFGIAEILSSAERILVRTEILRVSFWELWPRWKEWSRAGGAMLRGSVLGFFTGLVPGPSPVIAAFGSYAVEKRITKHPQEFGRGAIEGVAGPEAANNGAVGGAFVPLLSLGIPFTPAMGVLLAGFLILGIRPSPMLINEQPDLFWGLIASMYIGNTMLLLLNLPLVGLFASILRVPQGILLPLVTLFCFIGAYSLNNSLVDVGIMIAFGIFGYFLRKTNYDPAPLILGMILGPMMERALRQSLLMSRGSPEIFIDRPISAVMLGIAAVFLLYSLYRWVESRRKRKDSGEGQITCKW